jgi:hypothetical protein
MMTVSPARAASLPFLDPLLELPHAARPIVAHGVDALLLAYDVASLPFARSTYNVFASADNGASVRTATRTTSRFLNVSLRRHIARQCSNAGLGEASPAGYRARTTQPGISCTLAQLGFSTNHNQFPRFVALPVSRNGTWNYDPVRRPTNVPLERGGISRKPRGFRRPARRRGASLNACSTLEKRNRQRNSSGHARSALRA